MTAPQQDLAAALRSLRIASGTKADTVARKAAMSPSKLSKIENGKILPSITDVEQILAALEVSPEARDEFVRAARAAVTETTAWRELRRTGHWLHQRQIRAIEERAQAQRMFQAQLIPGLLQTAEYVSAIFSHAAVLPEEARARTVAARLERQAVLYDETKTFSFLLAEHVLRWRICPPAVMAMQLDRVAALSRLPNVSIGVLPIDRQMPDFPMTCFCIYDDRLVIVEAFHAEINTKDPKDIGLYVEKFDAFANVAVYGAEMRALVGAVRDDFLKQRESS